MLSAGLGAIVIRALAWARDSNLAAWVCGVNLMLLFLWACVFRSLLLVSVSSFFVVAIFIGMGVLRLYEIGCKLEKKTNDK